MAQARENSREFTLEDAIQMTAPGTSLRHALDMIMAGHLGALICVGDVDNVLAAGNDGFPLNISFTANRLFELAKMDGAVVIDQDLTQILRANFHLNPDPSLPTSETGMRHRTAARMSLRTKAIVISVSERRQVVNVYINGKSHELRPVAEVISQAGQLLGTLQSTRQMLDRSLLRLTSLELDNYVTLDDITNIFGQLEILMVANDDLKGCLAQLGSDGDIFEMQRAQLAGDMDGVYTLMIRDYARDSSEAAAREIRQKIHEEALRERLSTIFVGEALGFTDKRFDSVMVPLGLRTLSRVSVVREGMADKILDEYGSLQDLLDVIADHPERLDDLGVRNPSILADSLERMRDNQ